MYALRVVFESGREKIVARFSRRYSAIIALWELDMCGIAKAEIIEVEG